MIDSFKKAIFEAKSRDELKDNILTLFTDMEVGQTIMITWIGIGKPKYQEAVRETIMNLYQEHLIHVSFSEDLNTVTKQFE
jgi:hypothetical protein